MSYRKSRTQTTGCLVLLGGLLLLALPVRAGSAATETQTFLNEAVQGSVAEVSLGQMAEEKAQNPEVKAFGARMVNDHSQALAKARQLAGEKGVRLVEQLSRKHKQLAEKLAGRSGAEFDRTYMQAMVEDHRQTVKKFQAQANQGQGEVAAFARQQLPVLEEHLAAAESLARQVR